MTSQGSMDKVENQKKFEKLMFEKSKKLTNVKSMKATESNFLNLTLKKPRYLILSNSI